MPRIPPLESQASESQIKANRHNAQGSTGPRTADGKARSSQNALKHGFCAKYPVFPGEDPAEFAAFCDLLFGDLAPDGAAEAYLVQRFADIAWRLKRVPHFEAGLMTYVAAHEASSHDDGPYPDTANREAAKIDERPSFRPPALEDTYRIGRMLSVLLKQDLTSKLSRYEVTLQKQLSQTLRDLSKLQDERRARATGLQELATIAEPELLAPNQSVNAFGREFPKPGRIDCTQPAPGPTGATLPLVLDDV